MRNTHSKERHCSFRSFVRSFFRSLARSPLERLQVSCCERGRGRVLARTAQQKERRLISDLKRLERASQVELRRRREMIHGSDSEFVCFERNLARRLPIIHGASMSGGGGGGGGRQTCKLGSTIKSVSIYLVFRRQRSGVGRRPAAGGQCGRGPAGGS